MSLYQHFSPLDEVLSRMRSLRNSLSNSLEGLIGPMPQEATGRGEPSLSSGSFNGELQLRVESLLTLTAQCESLAGMLADECVNTKLNSGIASRDSAKSIGGF